MNRGRAQFLSDVLNKPEWSSGIHATNYVPIRGKTDGSSMTHYAFPFQDVTIMIRTKPFHTIVGITAFNAPTLSGSCCQHLHRKTLPP